MGVDLVERSDDLEPRVACRLPAVTIGLIVAAVLVLAGPVLAQDEASARVEPEIGAPGEDLSLIFSIDSPELAEVVVQERITCTVTFPDDTERNPCDRTAGLAEVHTTGSGAREYVFPYQAPAPSGGYEVTFEADSTARVQPADYSAEASFIVDDTLPGPQDDDTGGEDPPADDDEDDPAGDEGDEDPTSDDEGTSDAADDEEPVAGIATLGGPGASRLMVTTGLATGVLTVALVANRHPLGGG